MHFPNSINQGPGKLITSPDTKQAARPDLKPLTLTERLADDRPTCPDCSAPIAAPAAPCGHCENPDWH